MTLGDKFQHVVAVRHVVSMNRPSENKIHLCCLDGETYAFEYNTARSCGLDAARIGAAMQAMDAVLMGEKP